MTKDTDTGLKDINGTPLHLNDRVVFRYSRPRSLRRKAVSVELFGMVTEYRDDDIYAHYILFEQEDGKTWTIHDEDLQYITVIHERNPHTSKHG